MDGQALNIYKHSESGTWQMSQGKGNLMPAFLAVQLGAYLGLACTHFLNILAPRFKKKGNNYIKALLLYLFKINDLLVVFEVSIWVRSVMNLGRWQSTNIILVLLKSVTAQFPLIEVHLLCIPVACENCWS